VKGARLEEPSAESELKKYVDRKSWVGVTAMGTGLTAACGSRLAASTIVTA
jgi:hypothetical protein